MNLRNYDLHELRLSYLFAYLSDLLLSGGSLTPLTTGTVSH